MLKELNKMMHSKYAKLSHLLNVNKNEEWAQVFLLTSHKTMLHPAKARTLPSQLGMDRDCIQVGMQLDFILNTSFSMHYAGTATLQLVLLIRKLIWAKGERSNHGIIQKEWNHFSLWHDDTHTDNTMHCTYWETHILLWEWREKDHEKAIAQTHGLKKACVT